ncbi:DUF1570 domain-containing protein [Thalassoglobus sp.]|uniref:DUF1570 domain-containing protein n=1 Tax=Thalassoglobus sp. TaxID=2795869 RepID=UPI003AA7CC2E
MRFDRHSKLESIVQLRLFLLFMISAFLHSSSLLAESYTYVDEDGKQVTLEARSIGAGQGFQALERRDGQLQIVPSSAIVDRSPGEGPERFDREEMSEMLAKRFGEDLTRFQLQGNFVIGLVLTAPIEKSAESKAAAFIQKASRFMNRVDEVFLRYAKSRKFPLYEPQFPLVLLIFESDDDFNEYAAEATGGTGLSAANIAGFYSPITNWLAVRMSSCDSFEVPLHEAIHQQMYNRVLQRLAPIPKWFDEGIATGFEGEGERISISPAKVNPRYAAQAQKMSGRVNWRSVIENDGAFTADVLAGEAYTLAWCMHWLLANKYQEEYEAYVQELAAREPLGRLDAEERANRFKAALDVSIADLQKEFPDALNFAMKRQRIRPQPIRTDGGSTSAQALGLAELKVVGSRIGRLTASGTFKNMSPLRSMTFYLTVESGDGTYAEWVIVDLKPGRRQEIDSQQLTKRFRPAVQMPRGTYRVFIRSTPADTRDSSNWANGTVPGPYLAR